MMLLTTYWYVVPYAIVFLMLMTYWAVRVVVDCTRTGTRWWLRERKWHRASPHYGSVYGQHRPNFRTGERL